MINRILLDVMVVFQVSLNFDTAKEMLKIRYQIYILMKKVLKNSEENTSDNEEFCPPFFNHFNLSLNRKNRAVMIVIRKKLQKQSFTDILQNWCS